VATPVLCVAQHLLAVPAASTSSERMFSLAGLTLSDRRSNLSGDSVDVVHPCIENEIVLHRIRKLITYGLCNIDLHGLCSFAMTTL